MKELVYATVNPAKFAQVKDVLAPIGVDLKSLADFSIHTDIEENGKTAEDNAAKKATTYSSLLGRTVLSSDIALSFEGLAEDQQPGLFVRRINGTERANDQEMTDYYSELVHRLGDRVTAHWYYAFALAWPEGRVEHIAVDTPRIFTSTGSEKVVEGYPLESMQIDPASGKCISEMTAEEQASFWQRTIGQPLASFVARNLYDDEQ